MARAADLAMQRSLIVSSALGMVVSLKLSTLKILLAKLCEVAAEQGRNITDSKLWLAFVKPGHLIHGYISRIRGVALQYGLTRETVKYERSMQRVFTTDMFESSGATRNSLVRISGGRKGEVAYRLPKYYFRLV